MCNNFAYIDCLSLCGEEQYDCEGSGLGGQEYLIQSDYYLWGVSDGLLWVCFHVLGSQHTWQDHHDPWHCFHRHCKIKPTGRRCSALPWHPRSPLRVVGKQHALHGNGGNECQKWDSQKDHTLPILDKQIMLFPH